MKDLYMIELEQKRLVDKIVSDGEFEYKYKKYVILNKIDGCYGCCFRDEYILNCTDILQKICKDKYIYKEKYK